MASKQPPAISTGEMHRRLRLKFRPPEWISIDELRNSPGFIHGATYCDFVALDVYPSKGFRTLGVEVKVTRSDFMREIARPNKRKPWMETFHEFWFATPKGLVQPSEIPENCGLLETWGDDQLRVKLQAKQFPDHKIPEHTWFAICRRLNEALEAIDDDGRPLVYKLRDRQVSFGDLKALAVKLAPKELEAKISNEIYNRHEDRRKLDRDGRKKWMTKWGRVISAIEKRAAAELRVLKGNRWSLHEDDLLAWVRSRVTEHSDPSVSRKFAERLRRLADEMDKPEV